MNIAFLTPEYPHPFVDNSSGGIGTSIYNLADGLQKLGQHVTILVYNQSKDDILKSQEITIYKIKNIKFKGLSWWLTRKKIEKLINKLQSEKQIDLVEAPDWTGFTSFMNVYCPLILKLHGSDTYFCHLENRPVKWINKYHEKKALKNADAHISVSRYTAVETNKVFGTAIDFKVIANSVNTEAFKPVEKQPNGKSILYFGTLIRKKGALEIPHIFNKVIEVSPGAKLKMIGSDSYDIKTNTDSTYHLMQSLFSKHAIKKQEYLGKVPYHDVKKFIEESDVVIFPSFVEAFPVSWLEAMAMGKIVVASNIGWAKEIIRHGKNGFVHHPKEHKAFANSIIDILLKKVDVNEFSSNARATVIDRFSHLKVAQKNLKFYKQIINGQ